MIQLIGWTILHSLWQITLIAALYWIGKFCFRKASANAQYFFSIGVLIAAFLAPIFTFYYLWTSKIPTTLASTLAPVTNDQIHPTVLFNMEEAMSLAPASLLDYLSIILPYLVAFWGAGVLYFTFRFIQNLNGVNKLKNAQNEWIGKEWQIKIDIFSTQLGINKQVQVFLSTYVKEPLTFGHFKPVILLPISLITGFESKAIETIILHELAHIKRHDYLVNLGQSIIEIILFYHPLVWWLSTEIRSVREHCCDDMVLKMGDNRATYVETLTALQWRKAGVVEDNRLYMTATEKAGNFSRRIKRMFGVEEERFAFKRFLMLLGLLLLLGATGTWVNKQISDNKTTTDEELIIFVINDKTTKAELRNWEEETKKRNIKLDFSPSVFDENNQLLEVRGNYSFNGNNGDFYAINLPCTHVKFLLDGNYLSGPIFLHPCLEKQVEEMGNIFQIDSTTERLDLLKWSQKLAKNNILFNYEASIFDSQGKLMKFNANYKDKYSRRSFETDMPCSEFYYELIGDALVGPKLLKEGEDAKSIENKHEIPINLINKEATGKLGFTIYKGMSSEEFFNQIANFQDVTGAEIFFDNMTLYEDDLLVGSIQGNINPNRDGQQIHYFDIHDLDKYSLQLIGTANQIFPPAYIDIATKQVIKAKKVDSGEKSIFNANRQTTKTDLANWSKSILKHGVIFNYEKSVFDEKDRLIGLNGKFMGKCCYDDEFYINVEKTQVQLEIEDDYIYQPTIIKNELSSVTDLEEVFSAKLITKNESTKEATAKFANIDNSFTIKAEKSLYSSGNLSYGNEFLFNPLDESIKGNAPVFERFPPSDKKDKFIYWGNKKIPLEANFKLDYEGVKVLEIPRLEFTKKEWAYLRSQPFTFYLGEEWLKIKGMKSMVFVFKRKDPIEIRPHEDYNQLIKDENERLTQMMARIDVGDMLYYEKIDVGDDFNIGLAIKIIADPIGKSSGYHPSKDQILNENIEIDFQKAETDFSKGFIPAYQNATELKAFHPSFLKETETPNFSGRLQQGEKVNNKPTFVNGVKFDVSWMSDILPENIESINVVKGVKARTLFGVEEAILITTKKGTSNFLGKPTIEKPEDSKKN